MRSTDLLLLHCLLAGSTALAEPQVCDDDAPSLARRRWGLGFHLGWSQSVYQDTASQDPAASQTITGVGLLGGYARGGVQFGNYLGLEVELSGSGIPTLTGYLRIAPMIVFTPSDHFSIAAGPVAGLNIDNSQNALCFSYCGPANTARFAGATARLDLHLRVQRTPRGERRAVTLSLAGDFTRTLDASSADSANLFANQGWGLFVIGGYEAF